jgi:large subunit ribosomal protein L17
MVKQLKKGKKRKMRHKRKGRKLGRTSAHRKAMLINMATALFQHENIQTTVAKSKELRRTAEKLITLAKRGPDDLHARRMAARKIHDKEILKKLFDDIGPRYADRNGGYTRVIKLGTRLGDGAPMAVIELVD